MISKLTGSEIKPAFTLNANARPTYLYKTFLASAKVLIKKLNFNLPVFLLCEIIQSTHKSIYFV